MYRPRTPTESEREREMHDALLSSSGLFIQVRRRCIALEVVGFGCDARQPALGQDVSGPRKLPERTRLVLGMCVCVPHREVVCRHMKIPATARAPLGTSAIDVPACGKLSKSASVDDATKRTTYFWRLRLLRHTYRTEGR